MLAKTHLAVALFFVIMFFSNMQNFWFFLLICLIATLLPDIDSKFSAVGKHKVTRIVNFFTKHRGIFHSFTFLFVVSAILFMFFKEILLPFALGYSIHLLLDALTVSGVRIFYPSKFKIKGIIKTGKLFEKLLFFLFSFADLFLVFNLFFSVF
jgi:inner membrane protein